jgi:adenylate cyclase
MAALALIGILVGLFTMSVAANSIAAPLDELRRGLGRVGLGDLTSDVDVDDGGDVGQVQAGFNRMVTGLRERAELADLFGRHVGQEVAAQALERGAGLGGESRAASMVFVDLIGSTAMAEVLPPGEVVATLNAFFHTVVDTVQVEGGWVNKFEGDGALCIFGVPGIQPDHAARALRAARALHERLLSVASEHPGLDAGIGVSSGTVVAGNVGAEERFEYTVIGRPVNEAARLSDLAKRRRCRVLASGAAVRDAGPEAAHWSDRGRVGLRGQQKPTVIYEPAIPVRTPD